ncbi:S1C family serine protease [Janibacter sp. G56]|uniref:S1C family serine protease n=1 Tax=Janibacter sp. G56 TaxID=3418717 RepID=UPI003D08AC4F
MDEFTRHPDSADQPTPRYIIGPAADATTPLPAADPAPQPHQVWQSAPAGGAATEFGTAGSDTMTMAPATTRRTGGGRRLAELATVAVLAAGLASGGTWAATRATDDAPSATASSSSSTAAAQVAPVSQALKESPDWTATAAAASPSVVSITVESQSGGAQGSGVIIDDAGHVLTNNHVVSGAATVTVTLSDGRGYEAKVAGTDASTDLAVLTLVDPPSDLTPITLGDSDQLTVGDPVMAVGNPLGLSGTVTTGIVSALNRPVTTQEESQSNDPFAQQTQGETVVTNAIQTSAAINPGNSGGALVDASGRLVGINSSIASLGGSSTSGNIGIGFAIPVNEAKLIADQLIADGTADHSYLGVGLQDGEAEDGNATRAGAQIASVEDDTPAAEAGLEQGDVVIAVNDERVDSAESLTAHIRERAVGSTVTLTVLRNGERTDLTAKLAARPTSSN